MTHMLPPPFRLPLLSVVLFAGWSSAAIAEDGVSQLPTVVVSAKTPTLDKTIRQDELADSQARDLGDIYRKDSEISVGGGGNPIAQKVYIRGMEESMLNLSVDGAQINGKVYHHQSALVIDPQLLKTVEVEKGTAAASAGPGALGGAIRLETIDARDMLRDGRDFAMALTGGWSSNKGWRSMATVAGQLDERFDGLVSGSLLETQNYKSGDGQLIANSATEQQNLLAKFGFTLSPDHRLSASFQHSNDEGIRNARANMMPVFANPQLPNDPIPQSLARDTATLRYQGGKLGVIDKVDATVYRSVVESDRTNKVGRNFGEEITTTGMDVGLRSYLGAHVLKFGLNWREEDTAARNIANPYGLTGTGKESLGVLGGYVESLLDFDPVTVSAGMRFDDYEYTDNHRQSYNSSGFSPSAGISWQVLDSLKLSAGHSRALRGVGPKEAFMLDIARWKNASDIDPEKASNSELGFRFDRGGLSLSGNVYRQDIKNFITSMACAGAPAGCRDNAGDARIKGYELGAEYRSGALTTGLSVAHSKPRLNDKPFYDGDLGLGSSSGRTWVLHASYDLPAYNLDFGWSGRFVESLAYRPVGAAEGVSRSKQGYGVHDIYINWRPLHKDTLILNLAVKNLLNKQYYDHTTYAYQVYQQRVLGYPEAGRDVRLQATYRF